MNAIVEKHITDCLAESRAAKERGDMPTMYRLNTAYHWLDKVRRDLERSNITSSEQR